MNNMEKFKLQNKTILITGASSGIGRECVITCVKMGAQVILIDRNLKELEKTSALVGDKKSLYYGSDVTDYPNLEVIIKDAVSKLGKISGFIHSAGIGMTKPIKLLKIEDYIKVISINTISAFEIVRILSKKSNLPEDGASYVFISSVMGKFGDTGNVAYCSSKGALLPGAKAMALELARKRIRINCVLPGVVKTEMSEKLFETITEEAKEDLMKKHPLGFGRPNDVALACVYLLSDAAKWITGTDLFVDGGYSCQ